MDIRTNNGTRYYSGEIIPGEGVVFVFGSNPEGRHGAGAAKVARERFGAIYGQGEGLQGNAYALPTKDLRVKENRSLRSISPEAITENVRRLYETARQHPDKTFCIAYRNSDRQSLNGYTGIEMMRMFAAAGPLPENILVSEEWYNAGKEILSYESVQKQDKGQVLTLDELLNFHSGSMSQYVDDNLATANRPFEEVMGDALSNTVRDALERGDNPAVVRLWAERAMKENNMTEEQRTVAEDAVKSIVMDNDIVLSSDGQPLVLWHGSPAEFAEFDFSHAGDNTGLVEYTDRRTGEKVVSDSDKTIFFTDNRELAISYGFLARTQELRHLTGLMTDLISFLRDPLHPFFTDYIKSKKDLIEGVRILRRENDPEINAFLDRLPDLNGEKPISSMDENSREGSRNDLIQICGRYEGYYNMNRNGGISNRLDNLTRAKDYLQYFVKNFDRLRDGDTSVMTVHGKDFNQYNNSFYSSEGNFGITVFISSDRELMVSGFKDVPVLLKALSPDQRKEILQRIEDDLNACIEKYNAELEESGYRKHTHLYPVYLKAKNPLVHDYQGSAFPDKYKPNEKYETAYIAARQVKKALADGNDAVVYKNIRDPFFGDTYGVFSKNSIVMLDRSLFPEEQLNSTLGKVSGTVQCYIDLTNKKDMEQDKNNANTETKSQNYIEKVVQFEKELKSNLNVRYKSSEEYYSKREDDWNIIRYKAFESTLRDAIYDYYPDKVVFEWAMMHVADMKADEKQVDVALKCEEFYETFLGGEEKVTDIRKIVRELAHDIIGESSDMVELPGSVEIDVHASDTSHYHVCGARFDTKEQDYVFSAYRGYPYEDDVDVIREIAVKDMDIEDVESLAKSDIFQSAKKIASEKEKNESVVTFVEDDSPYYKERTRRNAEAADVTIAFAVDFNTAGEKCTRNVAGDKYVAINLPPLTYYKNPDNIFNRAMLKERVEKIEAEIIQLSDKYGFLPVEVNVNVAGNGLYTLAQHGISQADVDLFVSNVFRLIEGRPNIHVSSIRSGGQTGIDEAGIKAAAALDIHATVLAPKGWKFRDESGKDISDEKAFKARFPEGPVKKNGMKPLSEDEMRETSGGVRVDEPKKQTESGMKPLSEEEMRNTRGGVEVAQQPASPADAFKRIAEAAVASGKVKSVGELKDGWALVQASNGKYNFADAKGQFMTKRWLDKATEFSNGFATVERDGCKARINTGGIAVEVKNNMVQKTGNSPKIG